MYWPGVSNCWVTWNGRNTCRNVPVVLSKAEVQRLLAALPPKHRLFSQFLYGTGLRLMEGLRLRVKDVDFGRGQIVVHGGKGTKTG